MQANPIPTLFHCLTPTLSPLERFQTAFCRARTGLANVPVDHLLIVRSHGSEVVDYDGAEVGGWVGAEVANARRNKVREPKWLRNIMSLRVDIEMAWGRF